MTSTSSEITPLVLTFNEAPNLARTLAKLAWAKEIIVLDSYRTDETLDLVRKFPQARVAERAFDNHADQWNYGIAQVRTGWVLSLDADYLLSDGFVEELRAFSPQCVENAWFAPFRYCIGGRPLRGTLYPPRAVLFRKSTATYRAAGHTQELAFDGPSGRFKSFIFHDDRKALERWLREQSRYARIEAGHLLGTAPARLNRPDRIRRRVVLAPFLVLGYTLLGKGLILDGWPGWYYVFQRTLAEVLLSLYLIEAKLKH